LLLSQENLTSDRVDSLSEQEIFLLLNNHFGRETGPVTAATRSLYCSLLKNILQGKESLTASEDDEQDRQFDFIKRRAVFEQNSSSSSSRSTPPFLKKKATPQPQSNFFTKSMIIGLIVVIVAIYLLYLWSE